MHSLTITPAAQNWLASTRQACVLNAFGRACNLVNERGEVLALLTQELPLTPFALRVHTTAPRPFENMDAETRVSVEQKNLRIGELQIDTHAAQLWNPQPDWEAVRGAFSNSVRLAQLTELALAIGKAGSLLEAPHRWPAQTQLIHALHTRSLPEALLAAQTLAGRGSGLTPAGDDFIVGALLAVWAGLYGNGLQDFCEPLASAAAPRTTTLSGVYLHAAARGECTEQWHNLFHVLNSDNASEWLWVMSDLLAIGHTSGADALAGFIASTQLLANTPITSASNSLQGVNL
ncbi:MAG: DUF2877 domain-containing protein [Anaerolineales bacterium]|nr:DUF2877 domain-containing protein [Anaerolineales bacterium]